MKKNLLALALAAGFTTLTFAQTPPPSNPQTPPSQDQSGTKKAKKTKKTKKAKKDNTNPSKQ